MPETKGMLSLFGISRREEPVVTELPELTSRARIFGALLSGPAKLIELLSRDRFSHTEVVLAPRPHQSRLDLVGGVIGVPPYAQLPEPLDDLPERITHAPEAPRGF
jgi:hypothetical protein